MQTTVLTSRVSCAIFGKEKDFGKNFLYKNTMEE